MRLVRILAIFTYNLLISCLFLPLIFIDSCSVAHRVYLCISPLFIPLFFKRFFRKSYNLCGNFGDSSNGKVGAYLINLDVAVDRLNTVLSKISRLPFPVERVSAVDGRFLSREQISRIADLKSYRRYFKMAPEAGTLGCALSHAKVWRKFLESDNQFALVFEDDVVFNVRELSAAVTAAVRRKNLWDVVSFELNHHGNPRKISALSVGESLVVYLTNVQHAGCYLVNRRTAREFLNRFYPIKMPLDHYFTASWEFDISFCGVEPRIVRQRSCRSQIKISDSKKIRSPAVLLPNAIYHIKRSAIHTIYNLYQLLLS